MGVQMRKSNGRWYKIVASINGTREIECKEHSYRWSGNMPCTGMKKCIFCGKPEDETTFNGAPKGSYHAIK
jgi:hypothetical protein